MLDRFKHVQSEHDLIAQTVAEFETQKGRDAPSVQLANPTLSPEAIRAPEAVDDEDDDEEDLLFEMSELDMDGSS